MERLSDYQKAQKWLEGYDWDNDPTADDNLATICEALQEMEMHKDLEKQGKLLKMPCAVGDTVYHLCTLKNGESEIIEMTVGCVEPCGAIRNHKGICEIWNVYAETDYAKGYLKFFDFEKTVFLTREEAEAALKELEGKSENKEN